MNKNYWDLTDRPHTERKLIILEKYLFSWARIIFVQWLKNQRYKNFREIYFVDCFSGRGKYHKKGKTDSVDGSPLIALKCASYLQKEFKNEVKLKCVFVDKNQKFINELEKFCLPFKDQVIYEIYNADINQIIVSIVKEIGSNMTFFFIDPCSLSELDNKTIETIISKKGGKEIVLNYICGTKRVIGAIRKMVNNGEINEKTYKFIDSIKRFHTLPILEKCLNKSDKEKLEFWASETLKDSDLKYQVIYEMTSSSKKEPVYYLFFASRKEVAKRIMIDIFKKEDLVDYNGQQKLFSSNILTKN